MKNKDTHPTDAVELRKQAEALAEQNAAQSPEHFESLSPEATKLTLHELWVHQIELEMQNEELRRAQEELDVARVRYFDLYDVAPVGYVTISGQGLFLEANLTAASLLGIERGALVMQPICLFILKEDQHVFYQHRKELFETGSPQTCELRMVKKDGTLLWARMEATLAKDATNAPVCRVVLIDITERTMAEEKVRKSEEQFREVLENSQDASYKRNLQTDTYDYLSPVFARISGYTPEEMKTLSFEAVLDMIHPDDFAETERVVAESMYGAPGKAYPIEYRFKRKDGQYRWFEDMFTIMRDAQGHPLARIGSVSDITERKRVAEELRVAMNKVQQHATELAAIMDAVPTAVFVAHDVECRHMSGNRFTQKLLGLPLCSNFSKSAPPEERPMNFRAMRDGKDIPADQLPVQLAAHGKEIRDIEFDVVLGDGTVHTIRGDAVPLLDAQGQPYGAVGAFVDITERKRMEEALRLSRSKLEGALASTTDAISIFDVDGRLIEFNEACVTFYKFKKKDEYLKTLDEYPHILDVFMPNGELVPVEMWAVPRALRGETVTNIEYTLRRKDMGETWVGSFSSTPIRDKDGKIVGAVMVGRDITERKRVEEAKEKLELQNQQLQKAESLGRMAGAIAHHFNNQLQVVMMNLQMAMQTLPQNAEPVENLIEAMLSARKAAKVSTLMLTYLGQTAAKYEPLDLCETCQRDLPMLRTVMPQSATLKTDLVSPGPVVNANANQIQQILTSLLTNAWEAMSETQGVIRLIVKTVQAADIPSVNRFPIDCCQAQDQPYACLEVADAGCGIADKDIEKVFDPFFSTKFTGRGLGLSVVLGIVRAHGGCVTVESQPEHGSVFRVFLPLTAKAIPQKPIQVAQGPKASGGGTVLVVDDEPCLRKAVTLVLKRSGFTVYEAQDGVEAVEVFQQHRDEIGCVLCDLTMPRMDGWETLTALRKLAPDISVILSSGYSEAQVMAGDHAELPQAFLSKPYELPALKDTIVRVMGNRNSLNR